jgi:hypothetical protein
MKRLHITLLLILMLILLMNVIGCNDKEQEYGLKTDRNGNLTLVLPNSDGAVEIPVTRMSAGELSEYILVRSDLADKAEIDAALLIRKAIEEKLTDITLTTDWVKRGESAPIGTKEILIGMTNRPESSDSGMLRVNDYKILFENGRIVICGGSSNATMRAAELFIEYFIDQKNSSILIPAKAGFTYEDSYICDSLTLMGTELFDYEIVYEDGNSIEAANDLRRFILLLTGKSPVKNSDKKIIIGSKAKSGECMVSLSNNIRIDGSKEFTPEMAVRYFKTLMLTKGGIEMNQKNQKAEILLDSKQTMTTEDIKRLSPVYIFVSTDGNDDNDGSEDAPLATIDAARLKVRELAGGTLAPITVFLRKGEYFLDKPVIFDASDSGSEYAPVTYKAYENEEVKIYGGIRIDPSLVTKAADQEIVNRVIDKNAASKLMQIDLSSVVEIIPDIYAYKHTENDSKKAMEVYIGGKALDRSRWPNNVTGSAYLRTTSATKLENGNTVIGYGSEAAKRTKLWSEKAAKDLYIFGFLAWDWTNEDYDASLIDFEKNTITLTGGLNSYYDSIVKDTRFYFFNLPEEIDVPGESYIDREKRIVYFYPHENSDYNDIFLSTVTGSLFDFTDTKNIVIEGLTFAYTRGNAVRASGTDNFTMKNCTICHTSDNGASLSGSRITVSGCHIYDTARGGLSISGGDRKNLISGESIVENCEIHAINRAQATYNPGITASSFGMVIRNNKLYDCVHEMIAVSSNDIVIEYNEFFDCVLESADMGAIYFGRNPSLMGTVIRYNYFHDIGNPYGGIGQQSIFIDDGNNGAEIYGNVFWRGTVDSAAIKTHGAQFSNMRNNIFIDMPSSYYNADWAGGTNRGQSRWFLWLYDKYAASNHGILNRLNDVDFDSELWRNHYESTIWGELYKYIDKNRIAEYSKITEKEELDALAEKYAPRNSNALIGNVMVNIDKVYTGGSCEESNNYITDNTSIFKKFGEDFTLTEAALKEIRKIYPDFENIPFEKIGLFK